jgi:MFS family permease
MSFITFISFTLAQNFWHMFPTQIMLGASWATIYVGSLKFIMERNVERGTSTGLLNSVLSISAIIGPILGGVIVGSVLSLGFDLGIAYRSTMWVASSMAIISFMGFAWSLKKNTS